MEEIVYPKTMVVMLEIAQAKVKELGLALEQAQATIDRLEMVAQTEQQTADMWRKIAHNAYHDQVNREANP
jgi:hypothetical protein